MLIDEDTEDTAFFEERGSFCEGGASFESLDAAFLAHAGEPSIEVAIVDALVDCSEGQFGSVEASLSEHFPIAAVADGKDDAFAAAVGFKEVMEVFEAGMCADEGFVSVEEADSAGEVCAEGSEVAAGECGNLVG